MMCLCASSLNRFYIYFLSLRMFSEYQISEDFEPFCFIPNVHKELISLNLTPRSSMRDTQSILSFTFVYISLKGFWFWRHVRSIIVFEMFYALWKQPFVSEIDKTVHYKHKLTKSWQKYSALFKSLYSTI